MRFTCFALALASSAACGGTPFVAEVDGGRATSDGGGADAAVSGDAAASADAAIVDGAPGSSTGSLACGSASCDLAVSACCVYPTRLPPPDFTYVCAPTCAPDPNAAGNPVTLGCGGAASCAATEVCCIANVNGLSASACKAACASTEAQLCDPAAAQSGCAGGLACSTATIVDLKLPPTYGTCGGKGI